MGDAPLRRIERELRRRTYPLERTIRLAQMRTTGRPVVVLTPGKVASTAVAEGIGRAVPDRPTFHVHRLDPAWIAEAEGRARADGPPRPRHVWESRHLSGRLPTPDSPWDVVVVIRDPVDRAVSAFFQGARRRGLDLSDRGRVLEAFLADHGWSFELTWFDREVRPFVGTDVYAHGFDPRLGWGRADSDAARMLVLRWEDLDRAPEVLGDFLGTAPVTIARANVSADKDYGDAHQVLRSSLALPDGVLDRIYGSRFCTTFYSPDERRSLRARWTRDGVGQGPSTAPTSQALP